MRLNISSPNCSAHMHLYSCSVGDVFRRWCSSLGVNQCPFCNLETRPALHTRGVVVLPRMYTRTTSRLASNTGRSSLWIRAQCWTCFIIFLQSFMCFRLLLMATPEILYLMRRQQRFSIHDVRVVNMSGPSVHDSAFVIMKGHMISFFFRCGWGLSGRLHIRCLCEPFHPPCCPQ